MPATTDTSTKTLDEVTQHRRERIAGAVRSIADRIEFGDVERANLEMNRRTVDVTPEGSTFVERAPSIGEVDDVTITLTLQLGATPRVIIPDSDPED